MLLRTNDGRTRKARWARQKQPIAQAYEAAMDAARETSGLEAAIDAHHAAETDVMHIGQRIMDAEASTLTGIVIKARAIEVCSSGNAAHWSVFTWGPRLQQAVLKTAT